MANAKIACPFKRVKCFIARVCLCEIDTRGDRHAIIQPSVRTKQKIVNSNVFIIKNSTRVNISSDVNRGNETMAVPTENILISEEAQSNIVEQNGILMEFAKIAKDFVPSEV